MEAVKSKQSSEAKVRVWGTKPPKWLCKSCGVKCADKYYHEHRNTGHQCVKLNQIQPAKGTRNARTKNASSQNGHGPDFVTAYLFGKIENIIQIYAEGAGVPSATLAAGISELLRRKARGSGMGSFN